MHVCHRDFLRSSLNTNDWLIGGLTIFTCHIRNSGLKFSWEAEISIESIDACSSSPHPNLLEIHNRFELKFHAKFIHARIANHLIRLRAHQLTNRKPKTHKHTISLAVGIFAYVDGRSLPSDRSPKKKTQRCTYFAEKWRKSKVNRIHNNHNYV